MMPQARPIRLLTLGFSDELQRKLASFFYDCETLGTHKPDEFLEAAEVVQPDLLILDERARGQEDSLQDQLGKLYPVVRRQQLPLFCCLLPETFASLEDGDVFVGRGGVAQFFVTPVDLQAMARKIASELGVRIRPQRPRQRLSGKAAVPAGGGLWLRFREANLARVRALERATLALKMTDLESKARRQMEREAHKLAGSAGMFGVQNASLMALEAESILAGDDPLPGAPADRLEELVRGLRLELEGLEAEPAPAAAKSDNQAILSLGAPEGLAERLRGEGLEVAEADPDHQVRKLIRAFRPAAVLLDTRLDQGTRWQLLGEITFEFGQIPVLCLAEEDTLEVRLQLIQRGATEVIAPPHSPERLATELRALVQRAQQGAAVILAVDDDPTVHDLLQRALPQVGLLVECLANPMLFWEALEFHSPELLLLNFDMPYLSGYDLCRVVRADPRWGLIPIVFLSSCFDAVRVARIYQAGADDYIRKPVDPSELVARVSGRLSRHRQLRQGAEFDSLTGVSTRSRGQQELKRLLKLARRQEKRLSVAMLDLDHFKKVNDGHGHAAGDKVLHSFGRALQRPIRGEDLVARWGGEEFMVAMFSCSAAQMQRRLTHLLERFADQVFRSRAGEFSVTFSAGVAEFPVDAQNALALLELADRRLYAAKRQGRSCVVAD